MQIGSLISGAYKALRYEATGLQHKNPGLQRLHKLYVRSRHKTFFPCGKSPNWAKKARIEKVFGALFRAIYW